MIHRSYHGSPNRPFAAFDLAMCGKTSGLKHAAGCFFFTSEPEVASRYSKPSGFIGHFSLRMDNPLEMPDEEREQSIADTILLARSNGQDGVVLRGCVHSAISPGMRSDIFVLFDPARAVFESVELDQMSK